jgi:hypothetical protein
LINNRWIDKKLQRIENNNLQFKSDCNKGASKLLESHKEKANGIIKSITNVYTQHSLEVKLELNTLNGSTKIIEKGIGNVGENISMLQLSIEEFNKENNLGQEQIVKEVNIVKEMMNQLPNDVAIVQDEYRERVQSTILQVQEEVQTQIIKLNESSETHFDEIEIGLTNIRNEMNDKAQEIKQEIEEARNETLTTLDSSSELIKNILEWVKYNTSLIRNVVDVKDTIKSLIEENIGVSQEMKSNILNQNNGIDVMRNMLNEAYGNIINSVEGVKNYMLESNQTLRELLSNGMGGIKKEYRMSKKEMNIIFEGCVNSFNQTNILLSNGIQQKIFELCNELKNVVIRNDSYLVEEFNNKLDNIAKSVETSISNIENEISRINGV